MLRNFLKRNSKKNLIKSSKAVSVDYKDHLFGLIYCGGGGTRLWPFSRQDKPKQFLKIKGERTLFRQSYERIRTLIPKERIYVVTIPDYKDEVAQQLPEIPRKQVLVEPARRDTLIAAGLGAVYIRKKDPQAVIANLWSDQLIGGTKDFQRSLLAGAKVAFEQKSVVTTGVKPGYAHPGLEWVKKGGLFETVEGVRVYQTKEFIERPSRSGADVNKIYASKENLWHVGLWIWTAEVYMETVKRHAPKTYQQLERIAASIGKFNEKRKVVREYKAAPVIQIDMPISKVKESGKMYVVEAIYDWLDLGDFSILWRMSKKDNDENVRFLREGSEWFGIDTKGTLVVSEGKKFVATVGLEDMIVAVVEDAVLVIPRSRAQDVKRVVDELKAKKRQEYL